MQRLQTYTVCCLVLLFDAVGNVRNWFFERYFYRIVYAASSLRACAAYLGIVDFFDKAANVGDEKYREVIPGK